MEWSERESPYLRVAEIRIPRQRIDVPGREEMCERTSFNPWHALSTHRPLGGMNRVRRTIYAARYLSDPVYRRKISRQLNKGESLHALKRDLLYAHEGTVRARQLQAQTEQAWCLTLVTNAVVAWTTEYYGLAVDSMRAAGRRVEDEVLAQISPGAQREHQPVGLGASRL